MTASTTWYVYIVETSRQLFYTGIATDVERRFQQHRDVFERKPNARGAKYFRGHEPVAVVYREACSNRSIASQREHAIKRMSKTQKQALISFQTAR
jgi:putative endonuclease